MHNDSDHSQTSWRNRQGCPLWAEKYCFSQPRWTSLAKPNSRDGYDGRRIHPVFMSSGVPSSDEGGKVRVCMV